MSDGDISVYGPMRPEDVKTIVEAGSHVVADDYTMCSYGAGMVVVMVVSAT